MASGTGTGTNIEDKNVEAGEVGIERVDKVVRRPRQPGRRGTLKRVRITVMLPLYRQPV